MVSEDQTNLGKIYMVRNMKVQVSFSFCVAQPSLHVHFHSFEERIILHIPVEP